jgi:hypothetical protein
VKHCTQDVHVHIGMNGREHIYITNTQCFIVTSLKFLMFHFYQSQILNVSFLYIRPRMTVLIVNIIVVYVCTVNYFCKLHIDVISCQTYCVLVM